MAKGFGLGKNRDVLKGVGDVRGGGLFLCAINTAVPRGRQWYQQPLCCQREGKVKSATS